MISLAQSKLNEKVTVTCYGQTETTTRRKGLEKYYEGMLCSEGAEHERYETIFFQLMEGKTECSDRIPFGYW
jgi:hypothetical protein